VTFRFASAAHKALFDASPEKYIPQFGGYCANGIVYGIPWGGDADTWRIIDGKLYIFGGAGSRDAFLLDPARNAALAHKYWDEEVNGSNAFWSARNGWSSMCHTTRAARSSPTRSSGRRGENEGAFRPLPAEEDRLNYHTAYHNDEATLTLAPKRISPRWARGTASPTTTRTRP